MELGLVVTAAAAGLVWRFGAATPPPSSTLPCSVDPRVVAAVEQNMDPKYILDVNAGQGHRARALSARFPNALVVAMEPNPELSMEAAKQTRLAGLMDKVLHVRIDREYSVEPVDVSGGELFDVVVVGGEGAFKLEWACRALKPGGGLLVETQHLDKVLNSLHTSGWFGKVALCDGLALGAWQARRKHYQEFVANGPNRQYPFDHPTWDMSYLVSATRLTSRQATTNTIAVGYVKPPTIRVRDADGFRHRAGAVVYDEDTRRVVLVSSLKRPNEWTLPAGGVEANETLELAVVRETLEESGCHCSVVCTLGTTRDTNKRTVTEFFLTRLDNETAAFVEGDLRQRVWVSINDAMTLCSSRNSNLTALQWAKEKLIRF
ncbi:hypothetical protein BASA81_003795 [Batrachochytrium salamandrivorans]|nr:hypothetical protein BASA81_003795 [Batrachochytrium salamandrivorans]